MRLEGLAPTYSVDTAVGESDSIENQRVSTKFSRHTRFLHQPFQCCPTKTGPTSLWRIGPMKRRVFKGANVWIWGGVSMSSREMGASINYSEEVGFSGLTWGSPTGTLRPSWHCLLLCMGIFGIACLMFDVCKYCTCWKNLAPPLSKRPPSPKKTVECWLIVAYIFCALFIYYTGTLYSALPGSQEILLTGCLF